MKHMNIVGIGGMAMRCLSDLAMHHTGRIAYVDEHMILRRRLMDLGFLKDEYVEPILQSPYGGMRVYRIKRSKIALRDIDCKNIYLMEEGDKHAD